MLKQNLPPQEDNRSIFEIIDNLKRLQKEWIKKESQKKECDMCEGNIKCWFHRSGKEQYEMNCKRYDEEVLGIK